MQRYRAYGISLQVAVGAFKVAPLVGKEEQELAEAHGPRMGLANPSYERARTFEGLSMKLEHDRGGGSGGWDLDGME